MIILYTYNKCYPCDLLFLAEARSTSSICLNVMSNPNREKISHTYVRVLRGRMHTDKCPRFPLLALRVCQIDDDDDVSCEPIEPNCGARRAAHVGPSRMARAFDFFYQNIDTQTHSHSRQTESNTPMKSETKACASMCQLNAE